MQADAPNPNRILAALPPPDRERLLSLMKPTKLNFKEPMFSVGERIEYCHFPLSGVISLVTTLDGGVIVETGTVGRESVAGLPALLGEQIATSDAFCQIPGEALRIPVKTLLDECTRDGGMIYPLLLRQASALMSMLAQTAACNRAHTVEERMCRWLLMTRDRVDTDDFPLTQEFLGMMLGVRRPSVSLAASALQHAGLIRYTRDGSLSSTVKVSKPHRVSATTSSVAASKRHWPWHGRQTESSAVQPASL